MKHACKTSAMISLLAELIANDDTYSVKMLAKDVDVRNSGTICGAFSIHLKQLAPYIKRYGYELINTLVLEVARNQIELEKEEKDDGDKAYESLSEIVSY